MANKKLPSDYPQFSFRISIQDKDEIQSKAEKLCDKLNQSLSEEEKVFRKNEVITLALYEGLRVINSKGVKKRLKV